MKPRRPTLIRESRTQLRPANRSGILLAASLVAFAALATLLGAGASRKPIRPQDLAARAAEETLIHGSDSETVREALVQLRRRVSRSPLDSKTRVTYAGLLLGVSRRVEDTRAATFHAARAAELAPVTLSVIGASVRVLQRTGETDSALELTRSVFEFDPRAAARLLAEIEPSLMGTPVERGIPSTPDAWLAWSIRLHELGRTDEGTTRLTDASLRWPDHLPTLERIASRAARMDDWETLERLFPGDREFPELPAAAPVLLQRARVRAHRGEGAECLGDVQEAFRLGGSTPLHRVLAGEAHALRGAPEEARRQWGRALAALPAGADPLRVRILRLLARLEEQEDRPADALRYWQALLGLDPDHAEAKRHIAALVRIER